MKVSTDICSQGCSFEDGWIHENARYSIWGYILLGMGVSAVPKKVVWTCSRCSRVVKESKDRALINKHNF